MREGEEGAPLASPETEWQYKYENACQGCRRRNGRSRSPFSHFSRVLGARCHVDVKSMVEVDEVDEVVNPSR